MSLAKAGWAAKTTNIKGNEEVFRSKRSGDAVDDEHCYPVTKLQVK